jgi:hypothetical protein
MIIRKWAGFNSFQVVSPAYSINMRSIREYYERNFTPGSTRNENLTGPLQDPVGRIFEHMQNEECSLAHLVRAVSILLYLLKILEGNGTSLDQQTREEVEVCAVGLTREYLQRRSYDLRDLIWVLEWAPTRTMEEIAPQVPHTSIEYIEGRATLVYGTRLADLADLVDLADIADIANVADLADLACLARLGGLACLGGFTGFEGFEGVVVGFARLARLAVELRTNTFVAVSRLGSFARLALDETPKTID